MIRPTANLRAALLLSVLSASAPSAQVIVPKTVPVHQSQQFEIFPSDRAGMAGVSIALDDTVLDPFVNPAKATRAPAGLIQLSPFVHSVTLNGGGGRTLPVSGFFSSGSWAGAALFSLQQLDRTPAAFDAPLSERHATNEYVAGSLARRLSRGTVVGISTQWASLGGVDGVERLYSGSDGIQEDGRLLDVRLGLTTTSGKGRTWELVLLRNEYDMTQDVHYPDFYTYSPCCGDRPQTVTPARTDYNADHTGIWGLHTEYTQPVGSHGWRVGWLATANRLSHDKIPNYQISNLPRDPGFTNAFNAGVGISRTFASAVVGVDLVLEPMWSHTWGEAAHDTMTAVDGIIHAGGRTVDNRFRFSNTLLRMGFSQEVAMAPDSGMMFGIQAGVGLYAINYRLKQDDYVSLVSRRQDENWMEWTPTLGFHLRGRDLQVNYDFSLTCGPDCGREQTFVVYPPPLADTPGGGVIAAPREALRFDGGTVKRHRLTFSFRMR